MANWYCDPSLPIAGTYNAAPVAAGTVPTKPDDGDGKASGTAVMASGTITIGTNLNSGDTVSFNGKTFTAGTDFTIGGSASVTATNIAAAINALASTSTWTVGNGYQFRDLFNACVSGAVVTVYTRIGSADWNAITIATSSGGRATVSGFTGGASGAFGWILNTAALGWPSGSKAKGTYGLLASDPTGYVIANGDKINVRAGNGTTGVTLDFGTTSGYNLYFLKRGTSTLPVVFLIDDGTVWAADAGKSCILTLQLDITDAYGSIGSACGTDPSSVTDGGIHIKGKQYSNGNRNFVFRYKPTLSSTYGSVVFKLRSYLTLENCETYDGTTAFLYGDGIRFDTVAFGLRRAKLINHKHSANCWPGGYGLFRNAVGYAVNGVDWTQGELAYIGVSSASSAPLIPNFYSSSINIDFRGVKFSGIPVNSKILDVDFNQNAPNRVNVTLTDCQGVENFNTLFSNCFCRASNSAGYIEREYKVQIQGIKGNGYVLDSAQLHASWLPGLGFPYLNGVVEDNIPTSIRVELSAIAGLIPPCGATFFDTAVFSSHTVAEAKTLTAQFAIDENLTFGTSTLAMHATYQDATTGDIKYATTLVDFASDVALPVSTDTWYPESGGRPYYTEGTARYYNKKKLIITTPTTVKPNSMMRVWLTAHKTIDITTRYIFVDPYIQVV